MTHLIQWLARMPQGRCTWDRHPANDFSRHCVAHIRSLTAVAVPCASHGGRCPTASDSRRCRCRARDIDQRPSRTPPPPRAGRRLPYRIRAAPGGVGEHGGGRRATDARVQDQHDAGEHHGIQRDDAADAGPTQPEVETTMATRVATSEARIGTSYQRRVTSGIFTWR